MADPVRIALLGNSFASKVQLPALRWAGGNRVEGLAGRDLAKAQATAGEWELPRATDDWRELLEPAPDLVLVSTPVHLHAEMVRAALDVGAAVLCEKPFALNVAEAQTLVERAEGRPAWIDHQLRWSPHVQRLRKMLSDGYVGEPWHVRIELSLPTARYFVRPFSWWYRSERGGGMLGAIGSHLLDLARFVVGDVSSVRAVLETFTAERNDTRGELGRVTADEHASVSLRFRNGALGEVTTSYGVPGEHWLHVQVTGREGVIRLTDGELLEAGSLTVPLEEVAVEPGLPSAESFGMSDTGLFSRCLPLYLRALLEALSAGESEVPLAATFADGLAVQRMLDAARASHAAGGGWTPV